MKKIISFALLMVLFNSNSFSAEYVIDGSNGGMHSSVQFKASHVGISSLWGRFNTVTGHFTYDADDIAGTSIEVIIDTASIDTNHEARDIHLASADYLDAATYPEAKFVGTAFVENGNGSFTVTGNFSIHGQTKEMVLDIVSTGEGETPFGDYRVGFEGTAMMDLADYGIQPIPTQIDLIFAIEGIRQ
jgi:polyisoprenoid-binding protein YceI